MDGATINAKIYAGRAQAALRLGLDYQLFRPTAAINPFAGSLLTLKAAFNSGDNNYAKPNLYGDPVWFGDFDGRLTQRGDYLVRGQQIYFIAAMQPLLPIVCIDCNRIMSLVREPSAVSVGAVGYSGESPDTQVAVLSGWPAAVIAGGRGENAGTTLPASARNGGYRILLPTSVPVLINPSDVLIDDLGRRYVVESAELTDMGYRILALEEHT